MARPPSWKSLYLRNPAFSKARRARRFPASVPSPAHAPFSNHNRCRSSSSARGPMPRPRIDRSPTKMSMSTPPAGRSPNPTRASSPCFSVRQHRKPTGPERDLMKARETDGSASSSRTRAQERHCPLGYGLEPGAQHGQIARRHEGRQFDLPRFRVRHRNMVLVNQPLVCLLLRARRTLVPSLFRQGSLWESLFKAATALSAHRPGPGWRRCRGPAAGLAAGPPRPRHRPQRRRIRRCSRQACTGG